ncbi:hypothetical protein E2542_SST31103 [Spatholobus suberectus]|nr:hypothetical protein E2542_SST31103 [Spatholobus suberectus]
MEKIMMIYLSLKVFELLNSSLNQSALLNSEVEVSCPKPQFQNSLFWHKLREQTSLIQFPTTSEHQRHFYCYCCYTSIWDWDWPQCIFQPHIVTLNGT